MSAILVPLPLVALAALAAAIGGMQLARVFDKVALPSWADPMAALATGAVVLTFGQPSSADLVLWSVALLVPLVALAAVDIATHRLPDILSLALIFLGLGRTAWGDQNWQVSAALAAALVATGLMVDRFTPKATVGAGDLLLLGAAIAWIGPEPMLELAIVATLLLWLQFLCVAVFSLIKNRAPGTGMPLAPALALALTALWFSSPGS